MHFASCCDRCASNPASSITPQVIVCQVEEFKTGEVVEEPRTIEGDVAEAPRNPVATEVHLGDVSR